MATAALRHSSSKTIVVALSGGVDSSVAAALLRPCKALHMTNWTHDDTLTCSSISDALDAERVAQHLDISLERVSLEQDYWHAVFEPYLEGLLQGRRGNPDVDCNRFVKFGALRDYVREKHGEHACLATGHYARLLRYGDADWDDVVRSRPWLSNNDEQPILCAAVDATKDQSYFLASCTASQLDNVLFPLGELTKKEGTRRLAKHYNLPTAEKRESMGLCFVGKRPDGWASFIQEYLPALSKEPLRVYDVDTNELLEVREGHQACLYTRGQGAKVAGRAQKYFCVQSDIRSNELWVGAGTHHPALYADSLVVEQVHWTSEVCPEPLQETQSMRVQCRIRHLQPLMDCTLHRASDDSLEVVFDRPVRGMAQGQWAVFYDGPVCLGGGPIERSGPSYSDRSLPLDLLAPSGHNDKSLEGLRQRAIL